MPPEQLRCSSALFPLGAPTTPSSPTAASPSKIEAKNNTTDKKEHQFCFFKQDVWGFGILLCAMLTNNRPWDEAFENFKQGSPDVYGALPIEQGMSEDEVQALAVVLHGLRPSILSSTDEQHQFVSTSSFGSFDGVYHKALLKLCEIARSCLQESPQDRPGFCALKHELTQVVQLMQANLNL